MRIIGPHPSFRSFNTKIKREERGERGVFATIAGIITGALIVDLVGFIICKSVDFVKGKLKNTRQ